MSCDILHKYKVKCKGYRSYFPGLCYKENQGGFLSFIRLIPVLQTFSYSLLLEIFILRRTSTITSLTKQNSDRILLLINSNQFQQVSHYKQNLHSSDWNLYRAIIFYFISRFHFNTYPIFGCPPGPPVSAIGKILPIENFRAS